MPFFRRGRMQLKRTMFNSFGRSGPLPPPIFNGTYWYSPLSNNGNDTITNGSFINQGLSIKNVELTTGIQTIPAQTLAVFPNHSVYGNSISGNLIEPETTNILPFSLASSEGWSGSDVVKSPNSELAPDGTMTACAISGIQARTGDRFGEGNRTIDTSNKQVVGGLWVKANGNVGETVYVIAKRLTGDFVPGTALVVLTEEWQRVEVSFLGGAISTGAVLTLANSTQATADTCLLWNGQLEIAEYLSTDIICEGAPVTRAKDIVSCPTSAALVDANHGLTESGGTINLAGTKFDGLLDNKVVGACFVI